MRWREICWSYVVVMGVRGVLAEVLENEGSWDRIEGHNRSPKSLPELFDQHRLKHMAKESPVVVAHPKITEPPNIMKRKLGSMKWDVIHEGIQGQKRDAASCPTDYQSCAQSLNGGCCPSDRVCGTASCYAASAAPASACGLSGYNACGSDDGGGCCPENYVCGRLGCTAPVGVSYSQTCGVSSYLCPASLGYGCCKNGMGCGISNCYSTDIITYTTTETITTSEAGSLETLTSTIVTSIVPETPTGLATATSGVVAKITGAPEAAVAKTAATSHSSGGLTSQQLGGIIGGAVLLLLVLLIATFFIVRQLKKMDKAIGEVRSRGNSSKPSGRPRQTATPDLDNMSIDPLMIAPTEMTQSVRSARHGSQQSHVSHEVDASSPSVFGSPFPGSVPYTGGYAAVEPSDTSDSGYRIPSVDSTPRYSQSAAGYFDIPPKTDIRDQNLRFGHSPPTVLPPRRPSKHERQWSQSSEQSVVSSASSNIIELDAGPDGDRRSSLQRALQGLGMRLSLSGRRKSSTPAANPRKTSDPPTLTGGPTGRADWAASPGGLGHIAEAGESRLDIQELGNGTLSPEMRDVLLHEQARRERESRRLHEPPGQGTELLNDVDMGT